MLGLDPGSTKRNPLGWAILENNKLIDSGEISIELKDDARIGEVYEKLNDSRIKDHFPIDYYCYEKQFGPSGDAIKTISHVIAIARFFFLENDVELYGAYTPGHIKKIVTGKGNCKKKRMQKDVMQIYDLTEEDITKDIADAIGIVHTGMTHFVTDQHKDAS